MTELERIHKAKAAIAKIYAGLFVKQSGDWREIEREYLPYLSDAIRPLSIREVDLEDEREDAA